MSEYNKAEMEAAFENLRAWDEKYDQMLIDALRAAEEAEDRAWQWRDWEAVERAQDEQVRLDTLLREHGLVIKVAPYEYRSVMSREERRELLRKMAQEGQEDGL